MGSDELVRREYIGDPARNGFARRQFAFTIMLLEQFACDKGYLWERYGILMWLNVGRDFGGLRVQIRITIIPKYMVVI